MPQITCPHCGRAYDVAPEQWPQYQGQRINCTSCHQPFVVGQGPAMAPPPSAPPIPVGSPAFTTPPPRKGLSGLAIALIVSAVVLLIVAVVCGGLVSILLPSLNRARDMANRVKSASNLRQIGAADFEYANANNGLLPPDEKTLFATEEIPVDCFLNPRSNTPRPPTGLSAGQQADWVNANSDYAWTGAGLHLGESPSAAVVAYEKPAGKQEGMNVLHLDGTVEWVSQATADQIIPELQQGQNPPGASPGTNGQPGSSP